uniref:Uncharacterized protein n=1 Tax=Romanomermis culicivorax TaxID=13658 RepID=A0A915IJ25_ROMCU
MDTSAVLSCSVSCNLDVKPDEAMGNKSGTGYSPNCCSQCEKKATTYILPPETFWPSISDADLEIFFEKKDFLVIWLQALSQTIITSNPKINQTAEKIQKFLK